MSEPRDASGDPVTFTHDGSQDSAGTEQLLTSAADVESAGRSCLIILILGAIALLLICLWIGLRSTGAGQ